ncbi:leucine-rich repeat-containing protein 71-like [Pectinophora gossypiella]|uniref:leucine-rich repeat-containing protein 71-like n=1 Tax=Pectinophora gossypiella TaxID=13191 RepID=UPI00214E5C66|nr:leucine-rich repeat-containing protein 71-like [Pectinophora gossypiella]
MGTVPIKKKKGDTTVMPFTLKRGSVEETVETVCSPEVIAQLGIITVTALYDHNGHLVEILLYRVPQVPRQLIQAIAVIAPVYSRLLKISVRSCSIDGYLLHDLNTVLDVVPLTDLCLDDCYQPRANFALLLEIATSLRNLSLARCKLSDEGCRSITAQLHFAAPAETSLLLLNLSGNHITDVGAKHIAEMLRTNRTLRYLNLASNSITDDGMACIFDVLKDFALTYDEITNKRGRLIDYLRRRKRIMAKYLAESETWRHTFQDVINYSNRKSSGLRKSSSIAKQVSLSEVAIKKQKDEMVAQYIKAKVTSLTDQAMGQFRDPFIRNNLTTNNGWPHCIGNMTLCYLNLSYNYITYLSVKNLAKVLVYQSTLKSVNDGLLKVNIEGNNLPSTCEEYAIINDQLGSKCAFLSHRTSKASKKGHAKIGSTSVVIV